MEAAKAAAAASAQQPGRSDDEPGSDDAEEGEEYERRPRIAEKVTGRHAAAASLLYYWQHPALSYIEAYG